MVHFLDLIGTDMGKKVIPETVEYFCDFCFKPLSQEYINDYVLKIDEALRDMSGSKMNEKTKVYQCCAICEQEVRKSISELVSTLGAEEAE